MKRKTTIIGLQIIVGMAAVTLGFWHGKAAADNLPLDTGKLSGDAVLLQDVSKKGEAGRSFAAATIINAPPAKVCRTIQDYGNYPAFMPNTASAVAKRQSDDTSLVDLTLSLPLGKIKKYRLKMTPQTSEQACRLAWKMVPWEGVPQEQTIADTSGHWELTPLAGSTEKTLVKYYVYTDVGPVPLGLGWIVDSMSKDSIPKMLDALRARVQ